MPAMNYISVECLPNPKSYLLHLVALLHLKTIVAKMVSNCTDSIIPPTVNEALFCAFGERKWTFPRRPVFIYIIYTESDIIY